MARAAKTPAGANTYTRPACRLDARSTKRLAQCRPTSPAEGHEQPLTWRLPKTSRIQLLAASALIRRSPLWDARALIGEVDGCDVVLYIVVGRRRDPSRPEVRTLLTDSMEAVMALADDMLLDREIEQVEVRLDGRVVEYIVALRQ